MKVVSFATARSFPELRPILDRSWTKRSRSSVIRANAWSPHRSIERQPTQRWVGSVVLVLNEMVLVLVIDAIGPSRKIPANMRNRTPARVPTARGLLLAWQLATDRPAELPAGHRG